MWSPVPLFFIVMITWVVIYLSRYYYKKTSKIRFLVYPIYFLIFSLYFIMNLGRLFGPDQDTFIFLLAMWGYSLGVFPLIPVFSFTMLVKCWIYTKAHPSSLSKWLMGGAFVHFALIIGYIWVIFHTYDWFSPFLYFYPLISVSLIFVTILAEVISRKIA